MVEARDIEETNELTYSGVSAARKRSAQFFGTEAEPVPVPVPVQRGLRFRSLSGQ
jgi:hypothetical protein